MRRQLSTLLAVIAMALPVDLAARIDLSPYFAKAISDTDSISRVAPAIMPDSTNAAPLLIDHPSFDSIMEANSRKPAAFPRANFRPAVFDTYRFVEPLDLFAPQAQTDPSFPSVYQWLDDYTNSENTLQAIRQQYEINHPLSVRYNTRFLPEIPKHYRAYVDKGTTRIVIEEIKVDKKDLTGIEADITPKKWLHRFDASIQFSQAYISPNWYQGGNNNLNMIGQLLYNVKLNQKFFPKILFETTIQYKLAMNSAPDDSIHSLNITEDLFQINSTFGYKAARRWYYSANLMFKTQLFNSYPTNSREMKAALMSPGELNVGLGMTYNYTNQKKTFTFGASISPLSWNLKTCLSDDVNETNYGLDAGRRTKNKIGSSAECTLQWKIAYNIIYNSRLFLFTDYDYAYGDWEHTIDFNINRYLSTRLYVHMRYDTSTPAIENSSWHKFQFKEIFSFGFSYHFATL